MLKTFINVDKYWTSFWLPIGCIKDLRTKLSRHFHCLLSYSFRVYFVLSSICVKEELNDQQRYICPGCPRGPGGGAPAPPWATAAAAVVPGGGVREGGIDRKGIYMGVGTHQEPIQKPNILYKAPAKAD